MSDWLHEWSTAMCLCMPSHHPLRHHYVCQPSISILCRNMSSKLLRSEHNPILRPELSDKLFCLDRHPTMLALCQWLQQLHQCHLLLQLLPRLSFQQQSLHPAVQLHPDILLQWCLCCCMPRRNIPHVRPDHMQQLFLKMCNLFRICNELHKMCGCLPLQQWLCQQMPHQLLQ